jgi:transposase
MGEYRRKADGRRVFSTEFKRETVQRIVTGEKTLAELSRELDIAPSVIRSWKRFAESGATTAVQANEDVVPTSQLREAYAKIRELERALGRKTMEVEILRTAQEIVKKLRRCAESPRGDPLTPHRHLPGPADRAAHGVLREPGPAGRTLSPDDRSDGPRTDSRGRKLGQAFKLAVCESIFECYVPTFRVT